jgi:flavin-dependent dehydrogenase
MAEAASIVIGGGLAGSAFAIELARQGRPVVIFEKTTGQHHKVCGEFLSAEAQNLLARLGIDVWKLGARPASQLGLEFSGRMERIALPFCGAGLSRFLLDQALLDVAARAGAQVVRGVSVTKLDHSRQMAVVYTATERLSATHIALATGKHNLRGFPRPLAPTVAFKMHLGVDSGIAATLEDVVQLAMFPDGYAGACLVEGGIATICWVINQGAQEYFPVAWGDHSAFLSKRSSFFSTLLSRATPLWDKPVAVAAIPYGFLRHDVISDGIYPLGDQLVVIPSYTGDGTSIALHTGITAARAVIDEQPAGIFQENSISKLKPQIAWAKMANIAFVNGRAQRATAAIAAVAPWLVPKMAKLVTNMTRLRV